MFNFWKEWIFNDWNQLNNRLLFNYLNILHWLLNWLNLDILRLLFDQENRFLIRSLLNQESLRWSRFDRLHHDHLLWRLLLHYWYCCEHILWLALRVLNKHHLLRLLGVINCNELRHIFKQIIITKLSLLNLNSCGLTHTSCGTLPYLK